MEEKTFADIVEENACDLIALYFEITEDSFDSLEYDNKVIIATHNYKYCETEIHIYNNYVEAFEDLCVEAFKFWINKGTVNLNELTGIQAALLKFYAHDKETN